MGTSCISAKGSSFHARGTCSIKPAILSDSAVPQYVSMKAKMRSSDDVTWEYGLC